MCRDVTGGSIGKDVFVRAMPFTGRTRVGYVLLNVSVMPLRILSKIVEAL